MPFKTIKQVTILPAAPDQVFAAWLDSVKHGEMINGSANIEPRVGGEFKIWDGSIGGRTTEIDKSKRRIVQEWRYDYDDWPPDSPSKLTIDFLADGSSQTKLRLLQSGIPSQYAQDIARGWEDYYWGPMKDYFSKLK